MWEYLDCWDNGITVGGAQKLGRALSRNGQLEGINIGRNLLDNDGVSAFAQELTGSEQSVLTYVNLRQNYIKDAGAIALAAMLRDAACPVRWLNLHLNLIEDDGAAALADALRTNTTLETLSLRMCNVGIPGLGAFAEGLEQNNTIKSFDLRKQKNKDVDFSISVTDEDEDPAIIYQGRFVSMSTNLLGEGEGAPELAKQMEYDVGCAGSKWE